MKISTEERVGKSIDTRKIDWSVFYPSIKKEKATRHNKNKRKWSLVHYKSLEPLVEVLEFGAKKYGEFNWQKGLDKKEILESMMRHLTSLMDGEQNDKESGLHHIGHIMCNAMFYRYFDNNENTKER